MIADIRSRMVNDQGQAMGAGQIDHQLPGLIAPFDDTGICFLFMIHPYFKFNRTFPFRFIIHPHHTGKCQRLTAQVDLYRADGVDPDTVRKLYSTDPDRIAIVTFPGLGGAVWRQCVLDRPRWEGDCESSTELGECWGEAVVRRMAAGRP